MRRIGLILLGMALLLTPLAGTAEPKGAEKACLLMPLHADTVLEEKNAQERYNVAGLSKLPALLTLCHAFDTGLLSPQTTMQVSKKASEVSGPTAFLEAGEQVSAEELIKAAVMISAGDAIWTLMENAFGSEDVFLQNIGVILKECGVDLTLTSCLGTGTLFSCGDLIKLGTLAAESETFLRYAAVYMDNVRHEKGTATELVNANRMIRTYAGCRGLMTGSSREDGYCGLFLATRNETTYIGCVIGSPTSEARFSEAARLFDYAFANFRSETPAAKNVPLLREYPVLYGDQKAVDVLPHETIVLLLNKADGAIEPVYDLPEALLAPLDPNVPIGSVAFLTAAGETLADCALYPSAAVRSNGYLDVIRRILADYFT